MNPTQIQAQSQTGSEIGRMNKAKRGLTTVTYANMFLYSLLLLLLINPVSVFGESIDESERRATDSGGVKTKKVATIKKTDNAAPAPTPQPSAVQNTKSKESSIVSSKSGGHINCSLHKNINSTFCKDSNNDLFSSFFEKMSSNSGMLFRTMYVLLAVTGVVIVYFVIKAIRLRRRRSKSRKYGIITKQGDHGDMEMEPLGDGAEEDDDYTVFEMGRRK